MAERTAAEVLAMTRRALEEQEAARQLFEQEQTPEREFEYGAMVNVGDQQVPFDVISDRLYDQNLLAGLIGSAKDLFTGERREVLEPASVTYKDLPDRFDPATGRFTPMTEETITPGRFGPVEESFKFSPAYRGITSAAQFVEDMLKDPSKRQEALEMIKQFPEMFTKQMQASVQAGLMGERVVDPETGVSGLPSEALLAPIAALGAGRAVTTLPEGEVLGVFGGRLSKSGAEKIPEFEEKIFGRIPPEKAAKDTGVVYGADQQPRIDLGPVVVKSSFLGALDDENFTPEINFADLIDLYGSNRRILEEYPEIADLKVVVAGRTRSYGSEGSKEALAKYAEAAGRRGQDVKDTYPQGFGMSFYDADSKTLFVKSDASRSLIDDEESQARKLSKFNAELGSAVQNYIQQKEGFAPTETTSQLIKALAASPRFQDRMDFIVAKEAGTLDLANAVEAEQKLKKLNSKLRNSTRELRRKTKTDFVESNELDERSDISREASRFFDSLNGDTMSDRIMDTLFYPGGLRSHQTEAEMGGPKIFEAGTFGLKSNLIEGPIDANSATAKAEKVADELSATGTDFLKEAAKRTLPTFLSKKYAKAAEVFEREALSLQNAQVDGTPEQKKTLRELFFSTYGRGLKGPELTENQRIIRDALLANSEAFKKIDDKEFSESVLEKFNLKRQLVPLNLARSAAANKGRYGVGEFTALGAREAQLAQKKQEIDSDIVTLQKDFSFLPESALDLPELGLTPDARSALQRGLDRQTQLEFEASQKGLGRYNPNNIFFSVLDEALEKSPRKTGTPKEFVQELKSKVIGAPGGTFQEKDFDVLGLEDALQTYLERQGTDVRKPGKLEAADVALVLQTIDRPLEIVDLSIADPDLNENFRNYLLFAGPSKNNSTDYLIRQPARPGDEFVYVEPHYGGGRFSTTSGVQPIDADGIKYENILTHIRTTPRKDGDEGVLLIEELQPTVFQKGGPPQIEDVPLLKNKESVEKIALEAMLVKAAEKGDTALAVLPGYAVKAIEMTGDKDYGPQYDKRLPKVLKKLAKKYGITYTEDIPIRLEDGGGLPIDKSLLGGEKYAELRRRVVEMVEDDGTPGLYVMTRGLRFTPEKGEELLKAQIGRAQGGAVQKFANGGMVNNMRKPVLSRGLSGLLSNYTSGPLARMSVPRGTPQGMFRGGAPGMRDVGFRGPQRIPDIDIDQSAISASLANIPPAPAAQTNVAIQSPAERLATRTAVTPIAQALTGSRPTDFLGYETTEGVAELATAPGQTPFEPGMLITDPTGPTAEEIAAEQAAEEAAAQAAAEEAARIEAERLAAEEAARIAAEQEAARIQQEQLAAEQLAAEQAAAEQAAAQQLAAEQLAAEQLAAQEAAEAARQQELLAQQEAQRIAQEQFDAQVAAEQAAAQQTAAEVLAQEQAAAQALQTQTQDARVESASDKIDEANQKQVVADVANQNLAQATNQGADSATIETLTLDATLKQQDADAAALEAELAVAPDPTPIYEAPTQGELLQAAADADTGPLFTTPTDLGTVIPRSTLGLVPQTTGIMSFLGQPNFNVSDFITDYTSGYPSSQEMQFRRTFYPFQQVTKEEAQNQYMADIFKPVADMSQFRPALTFGERQQTREKGSGVPFNTEVPVGNVNTGLPASGPGQYGLDSNQMYQCPEGYTLAFEGGKPICKLLGGGGPGKEREVPPKVIELGGRG